MSYSIWIETKGCEQCKAMPGEIELGGYTYNLAPLWFHVRPGKGLNKLSGSTVATFMAAVKEVVAGIEAMTTEDRDTFNPSNGWGDHVTYLEWLKSMVEKCETSDPTAAVVVS